MNLLYSVNAQFSRSFFFSNKQLDASPNAYKKPVGNSSSVNSLFTLHLLSITKEENGSIGNVSYDDQNSYFNHGMEGKTYMGTDKVTTNKGILLKNNMDRPEEKAGGKHNQTNNQWRRRRSQKSEEKK